MNILNATAHAQKIQNLTVTIQAMTKELETLKSVNLFTINYKNGSAFRTFDLNTLNCDEERTLKAYKFLFEDKNLTQYEIGLMVYKWFTGKEKASQATIQNGWDVSNIVYRFSYAQFKSAIIQATRKEAASIAHAMIHNF